MFSGMKQDKIPNFHSVCCCKNCKYYYTIDRFYGEWVVCDECAKYDCSICTDFICDSYEEKSKRVKKVTYQTTS